MIVYDNINDSQLSTPSLSGTHTIAVSVSDKFVAAETVVMALAVHLLLDRRLLMLLAAAIQSSCGVREWRRTSIWRP